MKSYKTHINEVKQKYRSGKTSRNQLAGGFSKIDWKPGDVNLDYGGGKYEKSTLWMLEKGCTNLVFDIVNRTEEHNKMVLELAKKAETTTCFNVLNVIMEPEVRKIVIKECKRETTKRIYFTVYEGEGKKKGTGVGEKTSQGWQNYKRLVDYLPEVQAVYPSSKITKGMIVSTV